MYSRKTRKSAWWQIIGPCVALVSLILSVVAIALAANFTARVSAAGKVFSPIRVPIVSEPGIAGTAYMDGNVTDLSPNAFFHFQRTGDIVTIALEVGAEKFLRESVLRFQVVNAISLITFQLDKNIDSLRHFISPCQGTFGLQHYLLAINPASASQTSTSAIIEGGEEYRMYLWRSTTNVFNTPWEPAVYGVQTFTFSYGALDEPCQ